MLFRKLAALCGIGAVALFAPASAAVADAPQAGATQIVQPPAGVVERPVTVGSGEWAVRGMIAMPAGKGPFPGAVLVHGSGPGTLDMNVGGSTIHRDLAWGLAQRGVATIRYEKRTVRHRERFKELKRRASLREEFLDEMASAGRLLQSTAGIDPKRMYIVGNSQGGVLTPGVVNSLGFAGAVITSGSPRGPGDIVLQQGEHLIALAGNDPEKLKEANEVKAGALRLKNIAAETDPNAVILGNPVWYWREQIAVDPVGEIKRLIRRGGRAFVMQGARDYLVTESDWVEWQKALKGQRNVTLKLYPKLNHILQEGEGKMTPEEYKWTRPVSSEFIEDLAKWIKAGPKGRR